MEGEAGLVLLFGPPVLAVVAWFWIRLTSGRWLRSLGCPTLGARRGLNLRRDPPRPIRRPPKPLTGVEDRLHGPEPPP